MKYESQNINKPDNKNEIILFILPNLEIKTDKTINLIEEIEKIYIKNNSSLAAEILQRTSYSKLNYHLLLGQKMEYLSLSDLQNLENPSINNISKIQGNLIDENGINCSA